MRMPDLLATKRGRLAAFFFLYMTEGIPLGFTATAVATQMRRQGLGPEAIGAFVASLYIPWGLKWAFGPFVDVLSSERWGRRRMWIVLTQVMMVATLLVALPVDFVTRLQLFTTIIFLHNLFAATQDVAIDALAVNVLHPEERGLANGMMFGGAYLGQTIGGAGVLFLTPHIGFQTAFLFVAAWILAVTLLVAIPLREAKGAPRPAGPDSPLVTVGREIGQFVLASYRAFTGSRAAFVGLLVALLPAGAYALGLALQSNLAVELGFDDARVGLLSLWSTILSAGGCVLGGWLSDRFGRRRMLAIYILCMSLPTLYLASTMQRLDWILPVDPGSGTRPTPSSDLVTAFWTAVLSYSVFQGLMYGTWTALFMDVTTAAVAATQFTAYMALSNLVIAYSARWQGTVVERWGYPITLLIDSIVGGLVVFLLPFMRNRSERTAPLAGETVPEAAR